MYLQNPRLSKTDSEYIWIFLRKYDQYANELTERAKQFGESVERRTRPVELRFCIEIEYLESAIDLGFIREATSYNELTDEILRQYLAEKAEESNQAVKLEALDSIVRRTLRMDVNYRSAKYRMKSIFARYVTILRRNGLK